MNPIIIIPARMKATRLPDKPMAMIGGKPMIVLVAERAVRAEAGEVVVACDGPVIFEAVRAAGYKAILTDPDLPSGSDRIYQALTKIDPEKKHDVLINVQGDMPTLDPSIIKRAVALLENPAVDIGTLAAVIVDEQEKTDPAVVKVIIRHPAQALSASQNDVMQGRALSFSRTYAKGALHHIGIYAYRRDALEKFVSLPQSPLEKKEKLEQLRALEAGMRIDVAIVKTVPLGVDTPETLKKARKHYETI